jgi:probable rRNA maturation factor
MTPEVIVVNRQRRWRVDRDRVRRMVLQLLALQRQSNQAELGIHFVSGRTMASLNRRWLGHVGPTDVITFDHRSHPAEPLQGELFISLDDAVAQARQFHSTPSLEVLRYIIHGILHLEGHDDLEPHRRRAMKRAEDRWMRRLLAGNSFRGLIHAA